MFPTPFPLPSPSPPTHLPTPKTQPLPFWGYTFPIFITDLPHSQNIPFPISGIQLFHSCNGGPPLPKHTFPIPKSDFLLPDSSFPAPEHFPTPQTYLFHSWNWRKRSLPTPKMLFLLPKCTFLIPNTYMHFIPPPPPLHHHHSHSQSILLLLPKTSYLARRHPLCMPFSKENISMSFPTLWNWWFTYSSNGFTGPVTWRASVFLFCESYRSLAISCFVKGSWKLDFRDSESELMKKETEVDKEIPFFCVCVVFIYQFS